MKTLLRVLVWLVLLGAIGAAIVWATRPHPPRVAVHTVGRGTVEATVANTRAGTVNANQRARLSPGTGGQISRLLVREGDRVQAGQLLLEQWNDDLAAQVVLAESEAERATALAEQAQLQAELAEREGKRQEQLARQDISAAERVDRAVIAGQAARAAQRAAVAEAQVRRNQVAVVRAQLERTRLRAPFAGVVAEINGEVGEFATPSPVGIPTPPAVDLIDDGVPYVTAPIDEVDAARVRVGMPTRITMDAFGKQSFAGKVRRIAPYVQDREKQARTVDVEAEFAAAIGELGLLPGYSADVEILLQASENVLRVPSDALRDGNRVLVVGPDSVLAEVTIEPGLANWRFTEVRGGLQGGERIVLSVDNKDLRAGVRVQVEGAAVDGGNGRDGRP